MGVQPGSGLRAPLLAAVCAMLALASCAHAATTDAGPQLPSSYVPGGEPLMLAPDGRGGIWYGGAAVAAVSPEEEAGSTLWHLAAGGGVTRFQLPTAPKSRFAQYFATGRDGTEWFLAETDVDASVELGSVSPAGALTLTPIAMQSGVRLRGLAVDAKGTLWSTQSGTRGHWRRAGIDRIDPDGEVTVLRQGLLPGTIPANIAVGAGGVMWFLDDQGRVGSVLPDGRIHEYPLGRPIVGDSRAFAPMRPLLTEGGRLWFIVGPETIGEMIAPRRFRFLTPRSSYKGIEGQGGRDGDLVGLAAAADGDIWFTRDSGEVARFVRSSDRVQTITNSLVNAYGVAFDGAGEAWVGEGPAYQHENNLNHDPFDDNQRAQMGFTVSQPARLAELSADGRVVQYPAPSTCRIPSLIGIERSLVWLQPTSAIGFSNEQESLAWCEHRIRLGRVTIEPHAPHTRLYVIAQSPAPGRRTRRYTAVNITLAPASAPSGCSVPRPFAAMHRSRALLAWRGWSAEPEQEGVSETYYACVPGRGGAQRIVASESSLEYGTSIVRTAFAGHYMAYALSSGGKGGGGEQITVEDVATGRASSVETDSYASAYSGTEGPQALPQLERLGAPVGRGVSVLALAADGTVAWVGQTSPPQGAAPEDVLYVRDRHGIRRVAAAERISALRFAGHTLGWQQDGAPHTLAL